MYNKTEYQQITQAEFEEGIKTAERISDYHPVAGLYSYRWRAADNTILEKRTNDCGPTVYIRQVQFTSEKPF